MIIYKKGNLFDAPKDEDLLHACNCVGSWGAGVAAEFAKRFPDAYKSYRSLCSIGGDKLIGTASSSGRIICLFTSRNYGRYKDSVEDILLNTASALNDFANAYYGAEDCNAKINSPLINAGLFGVPWEKTESIINQWLVENPDVQWTVWKL